MGVILCFITGGCDDHNTIGYSIVNSLVQVGGGAVSSQRHVDDIGTIFNRMVNPFDND